MKINNTELEGVLIIETERYFDNRGYFCETYNTFLLQTIGHEFVQDNESCSKLHVVRGLHFQKPPHEQGKLVRVVTGRVLDVVLDLRKKSNNFAKHICVELSAENNKQLWIPPGFAHGFLALEDDTKLVYKCTQYYNKESEATILWNDKDLKIDWTIQNPIVSEKDSIAPAFSDFVSPF
jgi:dTDP-4-dehydrorhamnose 3,5-epimerase